MRFLLIFCLGAVAVVARAQTPEAQLKKVEAFRKPWPMFRFDAEIAANNRRSVHRIFVQREKALAANLEPVKRRGDLLLLDDKTIYFQAKNVGKYLKMNLMSRMIDIVSYAYLLNVDWSRQYRIQNSAIQPIPGQTQPAYYFLLQANGTDKTYPKVEIWADKNTLQPLQAAVYLSSGKLFRTLTFSQVTTIAGRPIISRVVFSDPHANAATTVNLLNVKAMTSIPANYFDPIFLRDLSKQFEQSVPE